VGRRLSVGCESKTLFTNRPRSNVGHRTVVRTLSMFVDGSGRVRERSWNGPGLRLWKMSSARRLTLAPLISGALYSIDAVAFQAKAPAAALQRVHLCGRSRRLPL